MTESLIGFFSFYLRARNSYQSKSKENVNEIIVFHAQVIFLLTGPTNRKSCHNTCDNVFFTIHPEKVRRQEIKGVSSESLASEKLHDRQ